MQEELRILDRARRRWKAIALALGLGHVLALLGVYLLLNQLNSTRQELLDLQLLHQLEVVRLAPEVDGLQDASAPGIRELQKALADYREMAEPQPEGP
jgi:hypothetical protein